jgi:hypothetical protein
MWTLCKLLFIFVVAPVTIIKGFFSGLLKKPKLFLRMR